MGQGLSPKAAEQDALRESTLKGAKDPLSALKSIKAVFNP
jgi:hypothetical protein